MAKTTNIDRYQRILNLRQEGKTFQEIADLMDVTRQRVFQIHQRASRRITNSVMTGNPRTRQTQAA